MMYVASAKVSSVRAPAMRVIWLSPRPSRSFTLRKKLTRAIKPDSLACARTDRKVRRSSVYRSAGVAARMVAARGAEYMRASSPNAPTFSYWCTLPTPSMSTCPRRRRRQRRAGGNGGNGGNGGRGHSGGRRQRAARQRDARFAESVGQSARPLRSAAASPAAPFNFRPPCHRLFLLLFLLLLFLLLCAWATPPRLPRRRRGRQGRRRCRLCACHFVSPRTGR